MNPYLLATLGVTAAAAAAAVASVAGAKFADWVAAQQPLGKGSERD